jgi:hypothetical protein
MPDNDIRRLLSPPANAGSGEYAGPADLFDERPNQAEVFRDLVRYLAAFLAIALSASLLVRVRGDG